MTSSRRDLAARGFVAIVVSGVVAIAVGACGGSGDEPSGTTSSPTPAESATRTESSAASQLAEVNGATLTAPTGWEVEFEDSSYVLSAPDDDHPTGVGIFNADVTLASDVDELAEASLTRVETAYPDGKRLPDVKYGGSTFFHLRGTNATERFDHYGTVVGDSEVVVAWSFNPEWVTRDEADEFINQVMPSFKFEG